MFRTATQFTFAAAFALCSIQIAHADLIETISSWDGSSGIGTIGDDGRSATWGQTLSAPGTDNSLDSFRLIMRRIQTGAAPDDLDFEFFVMEWDGTKATGPVLFQSAPQTIANGTIGYQTFDFTTGGINLQSGQDYIAFVSTTNFYDTVGSEGFFADPGNAYTGGSRFRLSNGSDFSQITSTAQSQQGTGDFAFRAEFSTTAIPEPSSFLMLGIIAAGVAAIRRRKRLACIGE